MANRDNPLPPDPSQDPGEPIRRARWLWHLCLFLPFVYVAVAEIVNRVFLLPDNPKGFWPMRLPSYERMVRILVALVGLIQIGVLALHLVFARRIRTYSLIPARAARLYWWRTMAIAACADSVTLLGLIVFLFSAQWEPLLGCCIYAYIVYAQAYPRARLMDEPRGGGD